MTAAFEIREIVDADLAEVVVLLSEGFPRRTPDYWRVGLQRLGNRNRPPDTERYGYVLVADNTLRGVVLTIPSIHGNRSERQVFINISSWYVQPAFRGSPAKELYRYACRRENVTYTNLSPAAHTIKTIKSLGFQEWSAGQMVAVGFKSHRSSLQKTRILSSDAFENVEIDPAESSLLTDHERLGCLTFCLEMPDHLSPFIFVRRRVKGFIPCAQLIYCRDLADLIRHGWAISRWLMTQRAPLMLIDASAPIEGLVGRYIHERGSKYFKGPRPARTIDHTYSEMVLLGF